MRFGKIKLVFLPRRCRFIGDPDLTRRIRLRPRDERRRTQPHQDLHRACRFRSTFRDCDEMPARRSAEYLRPKRSLERLSDCFAFRHFNAPDDEHRKPFPEFIRRRAVQQSQKSVLALFRAARTLFQSDHIDRAAWTELLAANPKAAVVVPKSLEDDICAAFALPQERVYGLEDLQTQRPGVCTLTGVASAHELLERDAKGEYLCMGAVIELGGFRIYQPGDTCLYEGLAAKLRAIGSLDAMLLPINGRDAVRYRNGILGNMTYQEAADFGAALQPGILIPAHYDLFQGNLEDPEKFTDYLAVKYPCQRAWVGAIGDYVILRKGETT